MMRQTCQNCAGVFRLVNAAQLRTENFGDFPAYADALEKQYPLRLETEPVPRIREGALCLNDPARAKSCLAVFQVGPLRSLAGTMPAGIGQAGSLHH
jgi:hypothetical protein